jgi:hypothetical protein
MLRKWWSLIRSVKIRAGVILLFCMHVLCIFIVSAVVTTYCFVVFGEAVVVVLFACHSSLCWASHLSVPCHFVYCFSGLVLGVSLGVMCSLEPSLGFVSDYSFKDGVWLDCQFVCFIKLLASQAHLINRYKSTKSKLLKCCANIYFNKHA